MPKYRVLRPIEHGTKLYLPEGASPPPNARAPEGKAISAGHGQAIDVDNSGVIELTDEQAGFLTAGQIKAIRAEAEPAPVSEPEAKKASKKL